jgi:glycosyltransferase involved in cell wall biosynthesis
VKPEVAVVIATRNRETRLAFALESLAAQTLGRDRFEVIVVRSGDASGPFAGAQAGLRVRFLAHDGVPGAAAQRNLGWRATKAPLVAFIDDDSRPAPDWLERLAAASGDSVFVQGRVEPDPGERHLLYGLARSAEVAVPSPRYEAGNIAYPRELLERLGGFDETFPGRAWGEDTDLGLRARAAGASPVYVDDAIVWHAVMPRTLPAAIREAGRYKWLVQLLARHPELRRELFPVGVVKESHLTLLVALAAGVALRRPVAAIAAVPYLLRSVAYGLGGSRATPRRLARLAIHLPAATACDIAELAVTLRAAVRHRVPVI